jgi:hypothetical protein
MRGNPVIMYARWRRGTDASAGSQHPPGGSVYATSRSGPVVVGVKIAKLGSPEEIRFLIKLI